MIREIVQTVVVSALLGAIGYALLRQLMPGTRTAIFVGVATAVFAINYFVHLNYKRIAGTLAGRDASTIEATLAKLGPRERNKVMRKIERLRSRP